MALTEEYLRDNTDGYFGLVQVPVEEIRSLVAKIQFLLDSYVDTPEGYFTFPDGDTWECKK